VTLLGIDLTTVLHRFNLPLYLTSLLRVTSLEFRQDLWHQKTRVDGLWYI